MQPSHRITVEPGKCGGKPCIRRFRIRVVDVLDMLDAGETPQDIVNEFPDLELEDIDAAVEYARLYFSSARIFQ